MIHRFLLDGIDRKNHGILASEHESDMDLGFEKKIRRNHNIFLISFH